MLVRQNVLLVIHFAYLYRQNAIKSYKLPFLVRQNAFLSEKYIFSHTLRKFNPTKCNIVGQNAFLVRQNAC
jgi:hypothetical protein